MTWERPTAPEGSNTSCLATAQARRAHTRRARPGVKAVLKNEPTTPNRAVSPCHDLRSGGAIARVTVALEVPPNSFDSGGKARPEDPP